MNKQFEGEVNIMQKVEVIYDKQTEKSEGRIGNITIQFTKTFNWFQRFMWKVCFGLEVKNLKDAQEK